MQQTPKRRNLQEEFSDWLERLSKDRKQQQRQEVISEAIEMLSNIENLKLSHMYSFLADSHGVSEATIQRILKASSDFTDKLKHLKAQTA